MKKVTLELTQIYEFQVSEEEAEDMGLSLDELIEYKRESLHLYGDDRLDALTDSYRKDTKIIKIEDV